MKIKKYLTYFSPFEWALWGISFFSILISFLCNLDAFPPLNIVASLLGVTALIFIAKGNVIGQFLIIGFGLLYGVISIQARYWGEMITYVFMSVPSSALACITWLKNPSKKGKSEVEISTMTKKKWLFLVLSNICITIIFYFLLKAFGTKNLALSTFSVTTSFFAAALLAFRSPYYAIGYACNDIVLISLWGLLCLESVRYLPMVICFLAFLVNDLYGFFNWKKMQKRQKQE